MADEIQDRESKIVSGLTTKYSTELQKQVEHARREIYAEYAF